MIIKSGRKLLMPSMIWALIFFGLILPLVLLFWKGVMWAADAAKMGYRWHVGNGARVLFWEDTWIGNCCLAVAFWDLYVIANEHHCTIASVWDGQNLMITFRRTVSAELYDRWLDLVELVNSISFSNEEDQPL
jgi:hypothetical protein